MPTLRPIPLPNDDILIKMSEINLTKLYYQNYQTFIMCYQKLQVNIHNIPNAAIPKFSILKNNYVGYLKI